MNFPFVLHPENAVLERRRKNLKLSPFWPNFVKVLDSTTTKTKENAEVEGRGNTMGEYES